MLEAAFIEARHARPVKAAGQDTGERGAGKATCYGRTWQAQLPNNLRSRSRVLSRLLTVYSVHCLSPATHDLTASSGGKFADGHRYAGWHYA